MIDSVFEWLGLKRHRQSVNKARLFVYLFFKTRKINDSREQAHPQLRVEQLGI